MTTAEREWCVAELIGPLVDWKPLPRTGEADDKVLATVLLRAWMNSSHCDCA